MDFIYSFLQDPDYLNMNVGWPTRDEILSLPPQS